MRRVVSLLALMLLISACSGSGGDIDASSDLAQAAQAEGEVTLYIVPSEDTVVEWVEEFEQGYGVSVATHRQSQNQLWERFQQEARAGQHLADVLIFNDPTLLEEARAEGWIAEYTPATDADYPDRTKEAGWWYRVFTTAEVVAWNTNEVTDQEADELRNSGIAAVQNGDWAGRLGLVTPHATNRVFASYYNLAVEQSSEYGWDTLEAIGRANPTFYESAVPATERLVAGEHAVLLGSADTLVGDPAVAGAPVEFMYTEPAIGVPFYIAISANAPHPRAAEQFVEWATTPEALATMTEASNGMPAHDGVEDRRPVAELQWYESPTELDTSWHEDEQMWGQQEEFLARWAEVFGYRS